MAEGSQTDKLCTASARGDLPAVLFLLENGADVNGYNIYGRTALQVGLNSLSQISLCQWTSVKVLVHGKSSYC